MRRKNNYKGGFSMTGYRKNSPHKGRDFNVIPSQSISMKNVEMPIFAQASNGQKRLMYPGEEHFFPGAKFVVEKPLRKAQNGLNLTDSLASQQGNIFEPKNNFVSSLDYNFINNPITSNPPTVGGTNTKEKPNLNFLPIFASSILSAMANHTENIRQRNYVQSNLANPFNYLPLSQQAPDYGNATYQMGGPSPDEDDEFLWEDDPIEQEQTDQADVEQSVDQIDQPEQFNPVPLDNDFSEQTDDDSTIPIEGVPNPVQSQTTSDHADAFSYLVNKGLQPHVAAGIIGNLVQESGLNPDSVNRSSGAYGIAQWLGVRKKNLVDYASSRGKDPGDLYTQLDYLLEEPGESKPTLDVLKDSADPGQAAVMFAKLFERMGESEANYPRRIRVAQQVYQNYLNQPK